MKLLFDQNISYKIVKRLQENFPQCAHVSQLGLENSKDISIWNYAKENDFCIVTFDYDFIDFSILKGAPPKIIIIKNGNTKTDDLFELIVSFQKQINDFLNFDGDSTFIEISSKR
jgi:predicted nuclease of predicted toxin-antitoxin system